MEIYLERIRDLLARRFHPLVQINYRSLQYFHPRSPERQSPNSRGEVKRYLRQEPFGFLRQQRS